MVEGNNITQTSTKASEDWEEPLINKYVIIRLVQLICVGAFVFGALWEGTIRFNFTTPQFLMVYGGTGAIISEALSRMFKKYEKKNLTKK